MQKKSDRSNSVIQDTMKIHIIATDITKWHFLKKYWCFDAFLSYHTCSQKCNNTLSRGRFKIKSFTYFSPLIDEKKIVKLRKKGINF